MSETEPQEEPSLAAVAFLYAQGELAGADAFCFEQRLGEEQAARDALCYAVLLSQSLEGQPAPMPDPAYRDRVRQRLRPGGFGKRLFSRRSYPGHPALWASLGLAAGLLLLLIRPHAQPPAPLATAPAAVTAPSLPTASPEEAAETAQRWANLHNSEHLVRARAEDFRRRVRDVSTRLVREDERLHPFLGPESKQ
jgi:hypothetical protein